MKTLLAIVQWVTGFFEDTPNKPQSFGRGMTFIVATNVLAWDASYVMHTHLLPDALTMGGQVAFMTCFYGVGKAIGAWTTVRSAQVGAPTPEEKNGGSQLGQ